jgi:hypothetical protein
MAKSTSKIVNAIHRLIKEEVEKQLEEKLKNSNYSEADAADYYTGQESEVMQTFSKDPTINKLLNETKASLSQNEDYSTMGGGAYTTNRMAELTGGRPNSVNQASMEGMPDFMKKAMSGQAAKIVKAMEEKNGTRHS